MKKDNNNVTHTSDIRILDLDKLDDDATIDYDKLSSEESLYMESKEPVHSHSDKENGFLNRILSINWHLILLVVIVFSIVFIIYRFKTWGTQVDLDNLAPVDENYDVEIIDNIFPCLYEGDAPAVHDDETNIVLFGNDTLAQNRGTSNDIANMIAELADANVYNCAVTDSYLTSTSEYINPKADPMDAFSLYWLTTSYALALDIPAIGEAYEQVFEGYSEQLSTDAQLVYDTLASIDFNKVDVIGIMYDANDYLAGKPLQITDDPNDILCYTGNLQASIELIKEKFPHIRIIIMSPTYAYALNPDGDYVSSDLYTYRDGCKLSNYALDMANVAMIQGVSFVDNFYGTINETNADLYLLDHINLNVEGRKKLAERFVYALQYYDEK